MCGVPGAILVTASCALYLIHNVIIIMLVLLTTVRSSIGRGAADAVDNARQHHHEHGKIHRILLGSHVLVAPLCYGEC